MIKVLIVDDSPLIRSLLTEILSSAPGIQVVGEAEDPYDARDKIKQLQPDVLTLDIEMPKMDGISFLKNLMRLRPMPVIMVSTLTQQGAPITFEALELGAVDYLAKPVHDQANALMGYASELQDKVRAAASARIRSFQPARKSTHAKVVNPGALMFKPGQLVAIGASTGGTEAIKEVLIKLPKHFPATVITQHIPPVFSTSFAERMNNCCEVEVKEAEEGDILKPGRVLIAPGDDHLRFRQNGSQLVCVLDRSEPVNRHRPAVDVMFDSIVKLCPQRTLGVLLTGMGADGARGLLNLRRAGASTIAQDEKSSVVWGMPKAAIDMDAADRIVPLDQVSDVMMRLCSKASKK